MTESSTSSRSKVVRLIEKYDLVGIGEELEERWTRSKDRNGLRQLAEFFNQRLLRAALSTGSSKPLDGEVENTYRLLTDGDVTSGVRTQARNRLEQNGVPVEELERDFVSRQAIHTYLTNYRDVEPPEHTASPTEQRERRLETIQRLKQRLGVVSERALRDLAKSDRLTLGEFNVLVSITVYCNDCDSNRSITELLSGGGCNCQKA